MTLAMTPADDARFMGLAFALGRRGLGCTWPNPAVGAVIVRDDGAGPVIVGRGWTRPGGRPHAETEALQRAGDAARGATMYVTLEPCSHHGRTPLCADAIVTAGVARVVSAMVDPNPEVSGAGHWRMVEAGVVVEIGVGAAAMRSPTFLEALLKQGLDPNAKDARGISAAEAARVHGEHSEVYQVIKRFDAGKS